MLFCVRLGMAGLRVLLSSFNLIWYLRFYLAEKSWTTLLLTLFPLGLMVEGMNKVSILQHNIGDPRFIFDAFGIFTALLLLGIASSQTVGIFAHYRRLLNGIKENGNGRIKI